MATKIIKAWIDGAIQDIEVEDIASAANELGIEERLFILEKNQSPKVISSVTLLGANWVGSASPYTQVVNINGVTPYSKIDIQPSTEQLAIFHEKEITLVAENENGIVTISCVGQKPMNDYTIQVTMTEVIVNE